MNKKPTTQQRVVMYMLWGVVAIMVLVFLLG